jgi:glutamate racemase
MKKAPIGVFDSGLGGLTALRRLQAELPNEDYIYFGDTARVPYGGRDKDTLSRFAKEDIALLRSFGVKAILVACGTVSSVLLEDIREQYPIPLVGVIESAAQAAAAATTNGKVGIWGTAASIGSGAYAKRLAALGYPESVAVPCPKLVPLIESGRTSAEDPSVRQALEEYLEPVLKAGADTLILGCTHYPLLNEAIRAVAGDGLALIDSGGESIATLRTTLQESDLLKEEGEGQSRYFVSGDPAEFARNGGAFLGRDLNGKVEQRNAGE